MSYAVAADLVLVVHLAFIVVVLLGAFGWLWFRWAPFVHLPMAGWGAFVELSGRLCPLTTLENHLLRAAGEGGYGESFVAHYLLAVLYPEGLTREVQLALAAAVIAVNVVLYAWVRRRRRHAPADSAESRAGGRGR